MKTFAVADALYESVPTLFESRSKPIVANDEWGDAPWTDQVSTMSNIVGHLG